MLGLTAPTYIHILREDPPHLNLQPGTMRDRSALLISSLQTFASCNLLRVGELGQPKLDHCTIS
jgi:hypothetical protein